jgi:hypothetical protein
MAATEKVYSSPAVSPDTTHEVAALEDDEGQASEETELVVASSALTE